MQSKSALGFLGNVGVAPAALQAGLVRSKGEMVESVPLFLSHQYKEIYDKSRERSRGLPRDYGSTPSDKKEEARS